MDYLRETYSERFPREALIKCCKKRKPQRTQRYTEAPRDLIRASQGDLRVCFPCGKIWHNAPMVSFEIAYLPMGASPLTAEKEIITVVDGRTLVDPRRRRFE